MKIVISQYGFFSLSPAASLLFAARKKLETCPKPEDIPRNDLDLVRVVETLGPEAAGGPGAELKVVEIPNDVDWEVVEHDGLEWVAEKHRTWH